MALGSATLQVNPASWRCSPRSAAPHPLVGPAWRLSPFPFAGLPVVAGDTALDHFVPPLITRHDEGIGYQSPGQAANDAAVGSAAVGTALGALAGAALGSAAGHMGTGAAIGAGTGLVAGSAVGTGNARAAGGSLQARYDTVYAQCMSAKGNQIAGPPVVEPVYVYPPPYYWGGY
jgi:hypothetical protein